MEMENNKVILPSDLFWFKQKDPETAQDFHVLNAYKDPAFDNDIRTTFPEHLSITYITGYNELPDGTINSLMKKSLYRKIEILDDTIFANIAEKYAVTPNDIKMYLMGLHRTGKVYGIPKAYRLLPDKNGGWIATFSVDIKEQDFKKMWTQVKRNKRLIHSGKMPKSKPPTYDKLLYAIFKARQTKPKPTTFKAIYDLYKDKKLPNYTGPTNMFTSEDKLEDYYRKHKPSP